MKANNKIFANLDTENNIISFRDYDNEDYDCIYYKESYVNNLIRDNKPLFEFEPISGTNEWRVIMKYRDTGEECIIAFKGNIIECNAFINIMTKIYRVGGI